VPETTIIVDNPRASAPIFTSRPATAAIAELDYNYAPYRPDEMHWFCKPDPSHRTHDLHFVHTGSSPLQSRAWRFGTPCALVLTSQPNTPN
jgi:hypothetical protein